MDARTNTADKQGKPEDHGDDSKMVDRYFDSSGGAAMVNRGDGDWVRSEDYDRLADLCDRMKTLLECVPDNGSMYAKMCKQAIAEAEQC
jgi:hypothetical protein